MTGKWEEHFFHHKKLNDARKFVKENRDKDLYMCPHGFTRQRRVKDFAVEPYLLYADIDEADPKTLPIKPTILIESSPGRFVGYWVTDRPAPESLNRRLTYWIDADKGGWDQTQVLRIPGTRDYKYEDTPRVKTIWSNGPEYELEKLEKLIPKEEEVSEATDEEALAIYAQYEKKLSRWARRELLKGKPTQGKRSEVLWKLQNECLEAGMSRDEAFAVLWVSPWNKFADRRNGTEQLWRELDKSLTKHMGKSRGFSVDPEEVEDREGWRPLVKPISEVEEENIDWLIPGMLARGELTILEGDPGLGKSYFIQMVGKSVCDGERLPIIKKKYDIKPSKVAAFDTENTAATVTKSRLTENGLKNGHLYFQDEQPFSIDDEDKWEKMVERIDELRPSLIIFDTINTYIGGSDTYRSSETQQAMGFFKQIATRFNCSVVVLRHLTKGSKEKAIYRGQGSIAFAGAARVVMTVGLSPDDPDTRVVACTKNNISERFQSFSFAIESLPDTAKRTNRSKFIWGDLVDWDADDIVSVIATKNSDKDAAIEFLKKELAEGPVEARKIVNMAEARSITKSTLNRAADKLGIQKSIEGFGKKRTSFWSLKRET